jgi:hypothetical protein
LSFDKQNQEEIINDTDCKVIDTFVRHSKADDEVVKKMCSKALWNMRNRLMSSPPVFSGIFVARYLVFCVMFCRFLFALFLLAIVLYILLRFTTSGYTFGNFKLFLLDSCQFTEAGKCSIFPVIQTGFMCLNFNSNKLSPY